MYLYINVMQYSVYRKNFRFFFVDFKLVLLVHLNMLFHVQIASYFNILCTIKLLVNVIKYFCYFMYFRKIKLA